MVSVAGVVMQPRSLAIMSSCSEQLLSLLLEAARAHTTAKDYAMYRTVWLWIGFARGYTYKGLEQDKARAMHGLPRDFAETQLRFCAG
jgi:hypothetical protein